MRDLLSRDGRIGGAMEMLAMKDPKTARARRDTIPVTLLTGFLGAGKTTLLNRLLADTRFRDTALVINEFGLVPVDHDLIVAGRQQPMVTTAGCACCVAGSDVRESLDELLRLRRAGAPAFSRVIMETTGLADPAPLINSLVPGGAPAMALRDHAVARAFRLANVVTVIDVARIEAVLGAHPQALRQIAFADQIALTGTEQADPAGALDAVSRLNPRARVAAVDELDGGRLLGEGHYAIFGKSEDIAGWLAIEERRGWGTHVHGLDGLNRHGDVVAIPLTREAPIAEAALRAFLALLMATSRGLLRVKGVVAMTGRETPTVVHGVGHSLHPIRDLDAWPAGASGTRLVVIGVALDEAAIRSAWDTLSDGAPRALPATLRGVTRLVGLRPSAAEEFR